MTVKIYSTPTCPWCKKTKEWMKEKKVKFTDIDVTEEDKDREEMIDKSGQLGVPVIDIDGEIIIGFQPKKFEAALKKSKK
ncbi:MAG: glutaredoxin family protein [archaeon]|nr:glutaredoxin family protein [Nanoarchaeota archaeon]